MQSIERKVMTKQELYQEYLKSVKSIKKEALDAGMNEEFKRLYYDTIQSIEKCKTKQNHLKMSITKYKVIIIFIIFIVSITYNWKQLYSYVICNLQDLIYPGLRILRKMTIPVISLFPSLSALYFDTCLIQNPFFTVVDMDCWPCSTINEVRVVDNPKPVSQQQNAPFIYETEQQIINLQTLNEFYRKHKDIFEKDSSKVLTNNKYYTSPDDIFNEHNEVMKNFYIWRFNTMNTARKLREIIPRPKVVPKFGQSTERYLVVDAGQYTYKIPDTECNFSFLLALSGSRTINLIPAEECKHQCKLLTVDLKETHLLWYNWWYWRPIVQASNRNTTFIAHVGSYC